jgi:hypothetical protein
MKTRTVLAATVALVAASAVVPGLPGTLAERGAGAAAVLHAQSPDRSKPPTPGPAPALTLPAIQKRQLSNGLPVWIVEMHEVPVAQVNLVVLSGTADDPTGQSGVAADHPVDAGRRGRLAQLARNRGCR